MKYRPHRGSLADAMAEVVELKDHAALTAHIAEGLTPFGIPVTEADIQVTPYGGRDERNGWDTHIVTMRNVAGPTGRRYFGEHMPPDYFGAVGFTDGPCSYGQGGDGCK